MSILSTSGLYFINFIMFCALSNDRKEIDMNMNMNKKKGIIKTIPINMTKRPINMNESIAKYKRSNDLEHLSRMIEEEGKSDEREKEFKCQFHARIFNVIYLSLAATIIILVVCLLREYSGLLENVLRLLLTFAVGFIGGFGVGKK